MGCTIIAFCLTVRIELEDAPPSRWAEIFVNRKLEFCRKYSNGRITSTAHGIDFFDHVLEQCNGHTWREEDERASGKLDNEYGKNFRAIVKEHNK